MVIFMFRTIFNPIWFIRVSGLVIITIMIMCFSKLFSSNIAITYNDLSGISSYPFPKCHFLVADSAMNIWSPSRFLFIFKILTTMFSKCIPVISNLARFVNSSMAMTQSVTFPKTTMIDLNRFISLFNNFGISAGTSIYFSFVKYLIASTLVVSFNFLEFAMELLLATNVFSM